MGVRSFSVRLLPLQRSLRLVCALLVFVFPACGNERTATPEEQIREGWNRYRLSEFGEALDIFESVEASQPRSSEPYLQRLFGQASCWNHRRDGRLINEFPRESRVFASRRALARIDAVEAAIREGRSIPPKYLGATLQ